MATQATIQRMARQSIASPSGALFTRGLTSGGVSRRLGFSHPTLGGPSGPSEFGFDVGGGFQGAAGAGGCDLLPFDWMKDACRIAAGAIGGGSGGGGGGSQTGGGQPGQPLVAETSSCPPGSFRWNDTCIAPGDMFPGGDPGTFAAGGVPVSGAFGLPAFQPTQVGSINGRPVRRCPSRTVLGLDNLCYPKGTIGRNYRKWPPSAKPPVSAFDARMMRKYGKGGSKAKAAKKLATEAGFACKAK